VIRSLADLVYVLLIVVKGNVGAAVGAGCRGWSLPRVAAAPQAAGCGPRFLPKPRIPARAAQPLPQERSIAQSTPSRVPTSTTSPRRPRLPSAPQPGTEPVRGSAVVQPRRGEDARVERILADRGAGSRIRIAALTVSGGAHRYRPWAR